MPGRGGWVPERPDGSIRPGEMRSGGYGFYYKGKQQQTSVEVLDTLSISTQIKPLEAKPRPTGQATAYSSVISSDVYFTNDKFMEVLRTHGIVIDNEKKTVTIQSAAARADASYDLSDQQLAKLNAASLNGTDGATVQEYL